MIQRGRQEVILAQPDNSKACMQGGRQGGMELMMLASGRTALRQMWVRFAAMALKAYYCSLTPPHCLHMSHPIKGETTSSWDQDEMVHCKA